MSIISIWALRLFGLSGIIGSLLFILGDLLYGHIPGSNDSPTLKMSRLPQARLLNAGVLGLFGCWLYTLASMHLYIALRPAGEIFAFIFLLAYAAVMICYGISHTAYFAIASGAQAAVQSGSDAGVGGKLGSIFYQRLVNITYIPVAISSVMMFYAVVTGQSMYPRWMVVFLPVFIYLLQVPVVRLLKGRLKEIVNDAYANLVLFIFYLMSTIVLWNGFVS
jgi:hypothetical protein